MDKILVISRVHRDDDNSIYNSYLKGILKVKEIVFIDYFNEYSMRGKKGFETYIQKKLRDENINELFFMFVSGDATLDLDFIYKITKNRVTYMVFWDLEQNFEIIDRYYAQCADLVFLPTNDYSEILRLYDITSIWTFSLFDKDKYQLELKKDIDVSFIGALDKGNRKEYLEFLQKNGIKVEIYGSGSKNGKISFSKMIEILNRSKISLNFSDIFDNEKFDYYKKINNRIKQNKGRLIEICMGGGFLLTENAPYMEKLLDINNIDIFSSKEELLEKVKYYLNNENERIIKAKNAQKEMIEKYDSLKLSKYLNIKYPKDKIIYKDREFNKIYQTFHFYYFLRFLLFFRLKDGLDELKIFYKGVFFKESLNYSKYHLKKLGQKIKLSLKLFYYMNKIKKLIPSKVSIYPAGEETQFFIKIFKPNFDEIYDDKDRFKDIENAKHIVLITNFTYNKILEQNLKDKKIEYINPFENIKINIFEDTILYYIKNRKIFDLYEGL